MSIVGSISLAVLVAAILSYIAFLASQARRRVDDVANATRQIISARQRSCDTGALRNRFRSSLGVMIDELMKSFGVDQQLADNGTWPCLVNFDAAREKGKLEQVDRWNRFNECVRPVMMEIDRYSVLRWFSLTPRLWQLNALINLCTEMEAVVGTFDSAFGQGLVDLNENDEVMILDKNNPAVNPLREDYRKLHAAWIRWRQMSSLALLTNYVF